MPNTGGSGADLVPASDAQWAPLSSFASTSDAARLYVIKFGSVYTRGVVDSIGTVVGSALIPGADAPTFEVSKVDASYAKDRNHVYYDIGKVLPSADPQSFRLLVDHHNDTVGQGAMYAADANHVWYYGSLIGDADPNTLTLVEDSDGNQTGYAKSHQNVFYGIELIMGADPITFVAVSDPKSGEFTGYVKDKNHVYGFPNPFYPITPIPEAGPGSFRAFNYADGRTSGYGLDESHVYFYGNFMPMADPKSFAVVPIGDQGGAFDAYDANHFYEQGAPVATTTYTN